MTLISAEISMRDLDRSIRGMLRMAGSLGPAWREAKKPIMADQRAHARASQGPDGKWAPRSPFTMARARARGRKRARRILGRLPSANRIEIRERSFKVESRARWSRAQSDGARVGHGAKLPARVWLWASRQLLETVAGIIARRLGLDWGKG